MPVLPSARHLEQLFVVQQRLTDRDLVLLGWLADHKMLTTAQIAAALFRSIGSAQRRLLQLTQLGMLTRFRPFRYDGGSYPYHYVLDQLGEDITAIQQGRDLPRRDRARRRRWHLTNRANLPHLLAVNQFFTDLAAYMRTHPGHHLERWWSSAQCQTPGAFMDLDPANWFALSEVTVAADGHGVWTVATTRQSEVLLPATHDLGRSRLTDGSAVLAAMAERASGGGHGARPPAVTDVLVPSPAVSPWLSPWERARHAPHLQIPVYRTRSVGHGHQPAPSGGHAIGRLGGQSDLSGGQPGGQLGGHGGGQAAPLGGHGGGQATPLGGHVGGHVAPLGGNRDGRYDHGPGQPDGLTDVAAEAAAVVRVPFFLEADLDSETHGRLRAKLDVYEDFAARTGHVWPVLFWFTSTTREANFHRRLHREPTVVPVATAATDRVHAAGKNPAEDIWWLHDVSQDELSGHADLTARAVRGATVTLGELHRTVRFRQAGY
jgi:predicted transcriptional regulator